MLAAAVHIVLFGALVVAAKWKAAHTVISVSEVQLWDKLPGKTIPKPPEVKIKPKPPEIEKKPEPKPPEPDPEPEIVEEKPDPEVEIALKKKEDEKKKAEEKKKKLEVEKKKKLAEKRKKEAKRKKMLAQLREDDLKQKNEALEKLQREINGEGDDTEKQTSAVSAGVVNEYVSKIQAKIRGNVNKSLCGDGNPELIFKIGLLPTGELRGVPTLIKSSGNSVCDDAVERAIFASEPLPLPSDAGAFAKFRDLDLTFRPNGN